MIPIKNIFAYFSWMDKIKKEYQVEVYPFYDDFHDEWHLAITDLDLYCSPEFESVISEVAQTFQEEEICLIALSEDTIQENKPYWSYLSLFILDSLNTLLKNSQTLKAEKIIIENFTSQSFTAQVIPFSKIKEKKFTHSIKQTSALKSYNWKKAS
ncbi:MAG: hypothetical protein N3A69_02965 [Leptospiraceae bacterium]|nr:hypothetical protein [Leptospiraceae bacterium]